MIRVQMSGFFLTSPMKRYSRRTAYLCGMQRLVSTFLAFLLLSTSIVPGMDARELAKISALADHYRHHVQEHGQTDLSFLDFLILHYGHSNADQDDDHSGLPLLSGHPTSPTLSGPVAPPTISAPDPVEQGRCVVLPTSEGSPQGRTADVFQPPKE